ncbi:hypothetical protein CHS0354_001994 [Potamilus streckersoni]|uniref:1-deoxy-D-xylulose-5-phosphate synthase n=1 Tax=Potamilus streckersoni TaxID=2493646 RepID=A0AAE0W7C6_9BIVA|nr:hypothetical protein CHS0354_001994 [Potamilus streckersoni]
MDIDREKYLKILSRIQKPSDVCDLNADELTKLAWACRQRIIDATSRAGGHLASSLGTVELTVALYNVYNAEKDHFVWDVGHQAYTHKILTGRSEFIDKIGTRQGVAKFLRREESKYDHFGAGHATTSLSAGVGMAVARQYSGEKYDVVCIIGDGAMTGGMAYEALNQAGGMKLNLKIILNDNEMSIDPNVGALSKAFNLIQSNEFYNKTRREISLLKKKPGRFTQFIYDSLKRVDHSFMEWLSPASWFDKLGFRYFGPVDGHDIPSLLDILRKTKHIEEPVIIHLITKKGKGYTFAENDSLGYHGVTPFEPASGKFLKSGGGVSYTSIWSAGIADILAKDDKTAVISAAMIASTGLKKLQEQYPNRIFDVGIAEQHAVTFAGGLAVKGGKPFAAIYSTFLQRAFDQIIHDIALQNLPVRFVLDRAGYVGADGATHHGAFDLSYLRMIPGMVVMAPKDGKELRRMIVTMHEYDAGPIAVRFPRGNAAVFPEAGESFEAIPIGEAEVIQDGQDILIFAVGTMVSAFEKILKEPAFDKLSVCLVNMRFIKPLDENILKTKAEAAKGIITAEENMLAGGFGSGICEALNRLGISRPLMQLGMPDKFIEYGTPEEQLRDAGLDNDSLRTRLTDFCRRLGPCMTLKTSDKDWWKTAVFYQIYPRSFYDANNDGIGDLKGITCKLDHLNDGKGGGLGVDAVWISPFFLSPMKDFGYDVSDYTGIDPMFGTMSDFEEMTAEAHKRGIRILIDLVLNHSSDMHPWFIESRSDRTNPKADWYIWHDGKPDGSVPNNWQSIFGGPAWTWDDNRKQYYNHSFLKEQPDLNWYNPEVQTQMKHIIQFWLKKGVDGFRLDTANFYAYDKQFRDNPLYTGADSVEKQTSHYFKYETVYSKDRPENFRCLELIRSSIEEIGGHYTTIGEIGGIQDLDRLMKLSADYVRGNKYLHMAYNFGLLTDNFSAENLTLTIGKLEEHIKDGWPCWSLGNHDCRRIETRAGNTELKRSLVAMLLFMRGTPILYYGDECDMPEYEIKKDELQDPFGKAFFPGI